MDKPDLQNIVGEIKRSFRLRMNGIVSASMRQKGVQGYLNWGIQFPELRQMAQSYDQDYDLAIALWKENVRECKILATLLMPRRVMSHDMVSLWMEQTETLEIGEYATYNVFQYVDNASIFAYLWMSSSRQLEQVCGFNLISCLFKQGAMPSERDINEFIDQALAALSDESFAVRHAASNSLVSFSSLGELQKKVVDSALKKCI